MLITAIVNSECKSRRRFCRPTLRAVIGLSLLAALWLGAGQASAQDLEVLPSYRPARPVEGTIRSWGHGFLNAVMQRWELGFREYHPRARFVDDLYSSAAAMAGLYSGRADLGILAREITAPEVAAYEKLTGQRVFAVDVLTGSYGDPDRIMALGVFVHRNNPVSQLSFSQLDAIFGSELRGGEKQRIRAWGQLGLTGRWRTRPIHPYSGPANEAPAYYFSQLVLRGSVLWNADLRQYGDLALPDGRTLDGYRRTLDAAGADPDAIVLTGAGYRHPDMKLIAIAAQNSGPFIDATPASVFSRSYPLSRPVRFYVNNGTTLPPDPNVIEFLRYVVSREGQQQALAEGTFTPLNADVARGQLAILDGIQAGISDIPAAAGLRWVARITLPQMHGTWDHLTADPRTGRLFLSAQDDNAVDVVDLGMNRPLRRIAGFFGRPQGQYYVPELDELVVTNGRDGSCVILDGESYELKHTIQLSAGADMIEYDRDRMLLFVESGGEDAGRGPGTLTLIDARSGEAVDRIVTGFRAAALALERGTPRLFVALPGAHQIAVVDRAARRILGRFELLGRPASMALDELNHRLFVATRTDKDGAQPARLFVIDALSGNTIATLDSPDATENMFYDAANRRIYASSLEGEIAVYEQSDPDHYRALERIATGPHAGTSQFIPELRRLYVAVAPRDGEKGTVMVYETGH